MFGFTFPVYVSTKRHFEILCDFLASIKSSEQNKLYKVAIINFIEAEFVSDVVAILNRYDCKVIQNPFGNSVSGAWNTGIVECFGMDCDFVMIPNVDVVLKDTCIDNLIKFWQGNKEKYGLWCARPLCSMDELARATIEDVTIEVGLYSFFGVSRNSVRKLKVLEQEGAELYPGFFDTNFTPAYFEDNDYDRRLHLANMKPATTHSAVYYHLGSQTIRNDKQLAEKNVPSFEKNKKYYAIKWHTTVKGNPDPLNDGGYGGAFNHAGHLVGNFYNAYKNMPREKFDAIKTRVSESSSGVIDCKAYSLEETFVAMYLTAHMGNKKLIFNQQHEKNGSFICSQKEYWEAKGKQ